MEKTGLKGMFWPEGLDEAEALEYEELEQKQAELEAGNQEELGNCPVDRKARRQWETKRRKQKQYIPEWDRLIELREKIHWARKRKGRTLWIGGGLVSAAAVVTKIVVGSHAKQAEHEELMEEIHEWPVDYGLDEKPFEISQEPQVTRLRFLCQKSIEMSLEELKRRQPSEGFVNRQEAEKLQQEFLDNAAGGIILTLEQLHPELELYAKEELNYKRENLKSLLIKLGLAFSVMTAGHGIPNRYRVVAALDYITEQADLRVEDTLASGNIVAETKVMILDKNIDREGMRSWRGSYEPGEGIILHRQNMREAPLMDKYGISPEEEERSILANEIGHVLFLKRFPGEEGGWEFFDKTLGRLDDESVGEMHSTAHQMKSSPLVFMPAIMEMTQENNDMKPGYGLTWEILKRAFRASGLFDLLSDMQGNRNQVITSGPVLIKLAENMRQGDVRTIEIMRKLRQEYIWISDQILETGKKVER